MSLKNFKSDMGLQWQRQAEVWMYLMGAGRTSVFSPSVSFTRNADTFWLEYKNERSEVTFYRDIPESSRLTVLTHLIKLLHPDAGYGIPLRTWIAGNGIFISATLPPFTGGDLWAKLSLRQQWLLDRAIVNYHENT